MWIAYLMNKTPMLTQSPRPLFRHSFLQYGLFHQNLVKDFIPTNMHTTVVQTREHMCLWTHFQYENSIFEAVFLCFHGQFFLNDVAFSLKSCILLSQEKYLKIQKKNNWKMATETYGGFLMLILLSKIHIIYVFNALFFINQLKKYI